MAKKYFVVEKLNELKLIKTVAEANNVRPNTVFVLSSLIPEAENGRSRAATKQIWFERIRLLERLNLVPRNNLLDCVNMIPSIWEVKLRTFGVLKGLREVSHFTCNFGSLGCNIQYVDIGGGIWVWITMVRLMASNSMNYSMQEYADDAWICEALRAFAAASEPYYGIRQGALTASFCAGVERAGSNRVCIIWDDER